MSYARPLGEDVARLASDSTRTDAPAPRTDGVPVHRPRAKMNRAQRRKLERDLKRAAKKPGAARAMLEKIKGAK